MQNRFLEMKQYLADLDRQRAGGRRHASYSAATSLYAPPRAPVGRRRMSFATPFAASQRALVILIENGGVDLGIGKLVDAFLDVVPGSSLIPQSGKDAIVRKVEQKVKEVTDDLLESAELGLNRYSDAKPNHYGEVIILRNGTGFYNDLRDTLVRLSGDANRVIDLMVLTHGGANSIALTGGQEVTGDMIRAIRTVHNGGKPLRLRSVYMMNCVGSSLNSAWLDVGAKVSVGSIRNNYLPEPTTFFFFKNWKAGQSFNDAAINAYRASIESIKAIIRAVGGPLAEHVAGIENRDFVLDSAPVIDGDGSLTLTSDSVSIANSVRSIPFTVVPLAPSGASSRRAYGRSLAVVPRTMTIQASDQVVEFIKSFEGFRAALYNDPAGHCTIGYGTLVHAGNCNGDASESPYAGGVTEERATELLRERLHAFELAVNEAVQTEMNQHQFDALVSFCYNVGTGAFNGSTLLRKLNAGDYEAVPTELLRWTKAGGKELPGLVRRRKAEAAMFTSGDYSTGQSLSRRRYATPFDDKQPRGIRNKNPGNIRLTDQAWEGKVPNAQNTDGAFEQFRSYDYGVRALLLLLRNYIGHSSNPRNAVRRIISAYAPESDSNHTKSYIDFLVKRLRDGGLEVDADTVLSANRTTLRLLAQAIGRMENGVESITDAQFEAGFALLPEDVRLAIGQSRRYSAAMYAGVGENAAAVDAANAETEVGELEDFGVATQMSEAVPAFCPLNEADDASTEHFALSEFRSKDGVDVPRAIRGNVQALMEQLEVLRAELGGLPITIVSGYRSPSHNASVKGAARSQHLCGRAADIQVKAMEPSAVHAKIEELIAAGRMLQGGLGKYSTFVHYDTRGTRARW